MSVQTTNGPRSRFIKAYLFMWALLAAGGLGYLVTLSWQGDPPSAIPAAPQVAELDPGSRAALKALTEVKAVRRSVEDVQKEVNQLKDSTERQEAQDKGTQSRLTALEERVTSLSAQAAAPAPVVKQKTAEKAAKASDEKLHKTGEPRSPTRIISVVEATKAQVVQKSDMGGAVLETGSIPKSQPLITFGEPVVMPVREIFGVQLAAAPSLEALRLSWSLLIERHGVELAALQPRYVAPRAEGGSFRLVAGPLTSVAEAERICSELQSQRTTCATTDYVGQPL
jgi:hypothetical protein